MKKISRKVENSCKIRLPGGCLLCFTSSKAENHAPQYAHDTSKWDLKVFADGSKQNHLSRDPERQVSSPTTKIARLESINRLLEVETLDEACKSKKNGIVDQL
jgi:hypothetical protein